MMMGRKKVLLLLIKKIKGSYSLKRNITKQKRITVFRGRCEEGGGLTVLVTIQFFKTEL